MFDIGWTEMLLIAVVAIIVIGPKDLPRVMSEMGRWIGRARAMARSFQDHLEEMSRQSGIDEVRKEVEAARHISPTREIEKTIDPDGAMTRQLSEVTNVGPVGPPLPQPETPTQPAPEPQAQPAVEAAPESADAAPATPRGPGEPPR